MSEAKKTIQSVAMQALKAGADNPTALKAVKKAFPKCRTNLNSISWYRNKLKSKPKSNKRAASKKKAVKATK